MKPVEPIQPITLVARRVVFAARQEEYESLPALVEPDGTAHTRWELTDEEREAIAAGACVTLRLLTFNTPLQPVLLGVEGVEVEVATK
jgi:hypothetical protein